MFMVLFMIWWSQVDAGAFREAAVPDIVIAASVSTATIARRRDRILFITPPSIVSILIWLIGATVWHCCTVLNAGRLSLKGTLIYFLKRSLNGFYVAQNEPAYI